MWEEEGKVILERRLIGARRNVLGFSEELNEKGAYPPKVVNETRCALCSFCQTVCPDIAIITIEKGL